MIDLKNRSVKMANPENSTIGEKVGTRSRRVTVNAVDETAKPLFGQP